MRGLKISQSMATIYEADDGLIIRVHSDMSGRLTGVSQDRKVNSSFLRNCRKKLHGKQDWVRQAERVWGRKTREGQIQPKSCSSHYIKEGGYVTPVGSCWGTGAELNTSRCVKQDRKLYTHARTHAHTHTYIYTHRGRGRERKKTELCCSDCRVMLSHKHERHAVVSANPVTLIHTAAGR